MEGWPSFSLLLQSFEICSCSGPAVAFAVTCFYSCPVLPEQLTDLLFDGFEVTHFCLCLVLPELLFEPESEPSFPQWFVQEPLEGSTLVVSVLAVCFELVCVLPKPPGILRVVLVPKVDPCGEEPGQMMATPQVVCNPERYHVKAGLVLKLRSQGDPSWEVLHPGGSD